MIEWDNMMELCGREAPETDDRCNEIRMDGFGACVLDIGHTGPHAYETLVHHVSPNPATEGMVLHCGRCRTPLTKKFTSTHTGFWCEECCYPPSSQDTFLARPQPKIQKRDRFDPESPFENDRSNVLFRSGYFPR